jgi:hypothetical protein
LEITDVEATAMIIRIPTAEWYDVLSTNIWVFLCVTNEEIVRDTNVK